jgi:hypothetical protein
MTIRSEEKSVLLMEKGIFILGTLGCGSTKAMAATPLWCGPEAEDDAGVVPRTSSFLVLQGLASHWHGGSPPSCRR